MRSAHRLIVAACVLAASHPLLAQRSGRGAASGTPQGESRQVLDTAFVPPTLGPPTFAKGTGPLVLIDEAHHNFHTASGRYRPFVKLLENDGFRVAANTRRFDAEALKDAKVLVIANALNEAHVEQSNWKQYGISAFGGMEIGELANWVDHGGSILLIADHMPFAGDAASLAGVLGFRVMNGFALEGNADPRTGDYPITFRRSDGTLKANAITNGRRPSERVDSIVSFTGSAVYFFSGRGDSLMVLPRGTLIRTPMVAWQFDDSTPTVEGGGFLQGAVLQRGKGRVAIFGEAAMFTAQRKGAARVPMGMNAPEASQNPQFILNVMHWLAGTL
jgi:hypothetical protein